MGKKIGCLVWLLPLFGYSLVSYESIIIAREKNVSSPFCSQEVVFVSPFQMEEGVVVESGLGGGGLKIETKWRFRWQTDKDKLYDHEWWEGKRDFRLFPEELFFEGMYHFQYLLTLGKKKVGYE
ncbi:MAG: hypothetical protein ACK4TN_03385 [Brevinematales bacterium]